MRSRWGYAFVVTSVAIAASALSVPGSSGQAATRSHRWSTGVKLNAAEAHAEGDLMATEHAMARTEAHGKLTRGASLAVAGTTPDVIGQWSLPKSNGTPVVGIHTALLKTGKVLIWSPYTVTNPDGTTEIQTMAALWNPTTNTSKRVDPPNDGNLFCGAGTILGDGTLVAVGGLNSYSGYGTSNGIPVVLLFNPNTETWSAAPNMNKGRWYPTITETMNGGAVVVGGRDGANKPNQDIETIGAAAPNAPQLVGTYNLDWRQGIYPNQFLLPNGQIFTFAGDRSDFMDPSNWRINKGPVPLAPQFNYPNAVVLPLKVGSPIEMVVYGGKTTFQGTTIATASRLNLTASTPKFTAITSMPEARANMNSVQLPDGKILVVGGNGQGNFNVAYYQTLLFDPANNSWTPLASQTRRRAYHSTALLLPDGRVLSAGDNGGTPGGGNTFEIYSPSYLFKGPRPVINYAPTSAVWGNNVVVGTTTPVTKLVLIAPSSTTHATDMHGRVVELQISASAGGGTANVAGIPSDGSVPPGPYMLFAVDANGIPSIATWIQIN